MNEAGHAMVVADDDVIAGMITRARRRVIVVAPGLSEDLAEDPAECWLLLGRDAVSITLDVDPEVCRLGYGDIKAVRLLQTTAARLGATLNTHAGIRIGVVIADDETLIFAPTPLNVEAAPASNAATLKPNAIRVGSPPPELQRDLGAGPNGVREQIVGLDPVDRHVLQAVEADLERLPPAPVDLSRMLRVYTARIEFVELRLLGCMTSRKTIKIPADLVGIPDEKTGNLLESTFRLIDEADAGVWGTELTRIRDFIVARFLVHLPTYGYILRLADKPKFELAVRTLVKMLNRARRRKGGHLQAAMNRRLEVLHAALLPAVSAHPPERWYVTATHSDIPELLREELHELAGTAEEMLEGARVELRYKGVTYETLTDEGFFALVSQRLSDMPVLLDEREAVAVTGRASS
ncbi:MAG TPA: hypothetical protein VD997_01855 [Phycisphaerales bacterium]|nr:hypothetical protein [Phycisphaerales bacterium]